MIYLRKFFESYDKELTIEDVDQIGDLFLSIVDKFKMIEVDYPTSNHVFSDEDEIIYRINTRFWNAGKTATLIDNDWDSEIESICVKVVALGWFESSNHPNTNHTSIIPSDVLGVYGDLVKNLNIFRERLLKFSYDALPIKCNYDYYNEMVDGEEITTEGISFTIQIKSKL